MSTSEDFLLRTYDRLRRFAKTRYTQDDSLFGTQLVHEAWLRVGKQQDWESEAHFFGAIRNAMRNATVDYLRKKEAIKRGGARKKSDVDVFDLEGTSQLPEIVAISDALDALSKEDPRAANVVTLKFFACMTEDEVAKELAISRKTVTRDWSYAKVWLQCHMSDAEQSESSPLHQPEA